MLNIGLKYKVLNIFFIIFIKVEIELVVKSKKKCGKMKRKKNEVYDEINHYIDGRYLSPMEAVWRLQQFPLCGRSHTVVTGRS